MNKEVCKKLAAISGAEEEEIYKIIREFATTKYRKYRNNPDYAEKNREHSRKHYAKIKENKPKPETEVDEKREKQRLRCQEYNRKKREDKATLGILRPKGRPRQLP